MPHFSPIVVFAHVPPPHHGQSYMVKLMLEGLKARPEGGTLKAEMRGRIADTGEESGAKSPENSRNLQSVIFYHVDARVSDKLADVGGIRPSKVLNLVGFVAEALKFRFLHGATALYYIPAPAKPSAVMRDIIVLSMLRPFFPRLILHWHAVGLGSWVGGGEGEAFCGALGRLVDCCCRGIVRRLLGGADPAIVIAVGDESNAQKFAPRRIVVVPNGIPDPCPEFETAVLPMRRRRLNLKLRNLGTGSQGLDSTKTALPGSFSGNTKGNTSSPLMRVLYLGHCTRKKGFFDALDGVAVAVRFAGNICWNLDVVGSFLSETEKAAAMVRVDFLRSLGVDVRLLGFLEAEAKQRAFLESDILLFPSYSESFGLVAVEALAFGLPVIGSDIPGLNAVLGDTPCARVPVGDPEAIGRALVSASSYPDPAVLRHRFEQEFTVDKFQRRITEALA